MPEFLHERRGTDVITNGNWGACQWTISENGTLTIYEGKAEGISTEGMSPWYDHSGSIRSVLFSGKVSLEKGSSLSCMFKDCLELKSIDLTNFDTERPEGVPIEHNILKLPDLSRSAYRITPQHPALQRTPRSRSRCLPS